MNSEKNAAARKSKRLVVYPVHAILKKIPTFCRSWFVDNGLNLVLSHSVTTRRCNTDFQKISQKILDILIHRN